MFLNASLLACESCRERENENERVRIGEANDFPNRKFIFVLMLKKQLD